MVPLTNYAWTILKMFTTVITAINMELPRRALVSSKAKNKQHAHASSGLHNHYSELITPDGNSKILKCCSSATITAIT